MVRSANNGAGLDNLLATIALDSTENYHIRTQAAAAVSKISNDEARLRLRPLLQTTALDDNDELKGYALRSLWPKHLSTGELLASLTPEKNTSWIGSYAFFLSSLEVPRLAVDDISTVLDWILSASNDDERNRTFDRTIPRFLERIWDRSDDPTIIELLANFFLKLVSTARYFSIQDLAASFFSRVGQSGEPRINLVKDIVRNTRDSNWSWLAIAYPAHLVSYADLPWLLETLIFPSDAFPAAAYHRAALVAITQTKCSRGDHPSHGRGYGTGRHW